MNSRISYALSLLLSTFSIVLSSLATRTALISFILRRLFPPPSIPRLYPTLAHSLSPTPHSTNLPTSLTLPKLALVPCPPLIFSDFIPLEIPLPRTPLTKPPRLYHFPPPRDTRLEEVPEKDSFFTIDRVGWEGWNREMEIWES